MPRRMQRGGKFLATINPRVVITGVAVVFLAALAWIAAPDDPELEARWYSVLPPLLAISFAIATNQIMLSLLFAVVVGGLLAVVPGDATSLTAWWGGLDRGFSFIGLSLGDTFNQQLLIFVVLVLAMVNVVIVGGGLHAIVLWLSRFARGRRSAQFATFLMGLFVFIDDYANTMIVGASMRPMTDRFKVSREKLAFLVDATSAPIAGLAVISTWVGYEVGLFADAAESLGIDNTGYGMLFDAIFFRFYCVLMLVFVVFNALSGKDFGPMRRAEHRANDQGLVEAPDAVPMTSETFSTSEADPQARIGAVTAILPVGVLFAILLGGIWLDGGGMDRLRANAFAVVSFTEWRSVISASENSVKILAYGAGVSLALAVVCARALAALPMGRIAAAVRSGIKSSALPCMILTFAWSLKAACDALGTGPFLVATIGNAAPAALFPAIVFIIAALTSFATGTSYGTMAILMPTAVPIAFALDGDVYGAITIITLASILDGSIVGDHCSPISDTTIMSSIASSCDHIHHVRTQLPYALTVAALALVCGYVPAGLGAPSWVGFAVAVAAIGALFAVLAGAAETRMGDGLKRTHTDRMDGGA